MYAVGGFNQTGYLNTLEGFDPKSNAWSNATPMPTPRCCLAIGTAEDVLYAVGGASVSPYLAVNEAFSPFLHVEIDIKPGDGRNTINLKSEGVVAVAILGSATFDPLSVDASTVTLAGAPVATRGQGQPMTSQGDFNRDGYLDLLLHFRTQDMRALAPSPVRTPALQATEAVLYGTTTTGQRVRGADSVRLVPFTPAPRAGSAASRNLGKSPFR